MWDEQSHIYLAGRLRLRKPRVGPWVGQSGQRASLYGRPVAKPTGQRTRSAAHGDRDHYLAE
jgi:hypothetical protein